VVAQRPAFARKLVSHSSAGRCVVVRDVKRNAPAIEETLKGVSLMKNIFLVLVLLISFSIGTRRSFAQWTQVATIDAADGHSFAVSAFAVSGNNFFSGGPGGVYLSTDGGAIWKRCNTGLADTNITSIAVFGQTLFAETYESGIFRSTNNGVSWTQVNSGLTNTRVSSFAELGAIVFVATQSGVFRSSNNGTTWTQVNAGLTDTLVGSLAVMGGNVFASARGGIFLSSNAGQSWIKIDSSLRNSHVIVFVNSLTAVGNILFAETYGGVYRSTSNGASWTQVNVGLTDTVVFALANSGTNIFVGTRDGVFHSTNNGASWDQVNAGLITDALVVPRLAVMGTNLIAGTIYAGIWSRPIQEMMTAVKTKSGSIPSRFALSQNYPNPFNPSTIINYQLPASSHVTMKVYDVLGREVTTLVDERQGAGVHAVTFNAGHLPSGVYLYHLQAGTFTETKKLTVLK